MSVEMLRVTELGVAGRRDVASRANRIWYHSPSTLDPYSMDNAVQEVTLL